MSDLKKELSKGKVCVFETDTVVGLGCALKTNSSYNLDGIKKLYKIKGRDLSKPISWLVADIEQAKQYCEISFDVETYIADRWPGSYTFILNAKETVPKGFGSLKNGKRTLGVRQPDSKLLTTLMKELDCPLVCTSANLSGEVAPTTIDKVSEDVLRCADFVCEEPIFEGAYGRDSCTCNEDCHLDSTHTKKENSSSVIDLIGDNPVVLRG